MRKPATQSIQASRIPADSSARLYRRSLWAAVLIGVGMMAAIDEIVFHQLLGWHHFYDRATPMIGLFSDGLLHAAELIAIVAGGFLIADLLNRKALARSWAWAGFFLGLGGFQLFDGIINHKVLRLHQIRYGVYLLPYDVAWIGAGLALFVVGIVLLLRAQAATRHAEPGDADQS
jgi:uncharacterized membrane protein